MSELTMNTVSGMYDEVAEIQNLNKVEGFDPRKYMRIIQKEGQTGKYYLDVVYRKLWFRLKYPEGKIVKKILKLTDQMAIVEAKVYLSRNDAEDSFISNAMAQKYMTGDDQFGNKFVELAETAAVGRALADAGFGLQFADTEGELDPEVTDAPLDVNLMAGGGNMPLPKGTYMDVELINPAGETEMEPASSISEYEIPGQYGIESYLSNPEDGMQTSRPQVVQNPQPQAVQSVPQRQNTGQGTGKQPPQTIDKKLPVEQIYTMLTWEKAVSVVVPVGVFKNKTLGQVAMEKPSSLEWYVSSYGGPDNLLRAAAKFLLDVAKEQAS